MKVVSYWDDGARGICQNPELASSFANTFAPASRPSVCPCSSRLSQHNQPPLVLQGSESHTPSDSEMTFAGHTYSNNNNNDVDVFPKPLPRRQSAIELAQWLQHVIVRTYRPLRGCFSVITFIDYSSICPSVQLEADFCPTLSPHCLHGNGRCPWVVFLCHLPRNATSGSGYLDIASRDFIDLHAILKLPILRQLKHVASHAGHIAF